MKKIAYSLFILLVAVSCDVKKSNVSPDYNFVKVFDNTDLTVSYYPVDAMETADGGFIVLSALDATQNTNFPAVHVLKTDQNGNMAWEATADAGYVSPVPGLMNTGNSIQFFCMDDNSFKAKLMTINDNGSTGTISEAGGTNDSYPLAAYYSNSANRIVLLSYDGIGMNTVISSYDKNLSGSFRISTSTNKDFSYEIFQHLKKQHTPFPFFIRDFVSNGNTFYAVNALSNYTLSLLFVDQSTGSITGRLNGYQESGGISAVHYLGGDTFAIAASQFNTGNVFIGPDISIDDHATQNVSDLQPLAFPELKADAPVKMLEDKFNDKAMIVYAATTKTDQIALYFYDKTTFELQKTKYLGHTNPVELAALFRTSDGGLAVAGKTWVAGRYQRIILYKLALEELGL